VLARKVTIVIPTHNRRVDVLRCLGSVYKLHYNDYDVIVVDNASTDETYNDISKQFPQVKIIRNSKNLGVTGGRNAGLINADGDCIFFLDNDTVVDPEALRRLIEIIENDHQVGMVGPTVYYLDQPDVIWARGASINPLTAKNSFNQKELKRETDAMEVQVLPTAFLVTRQVIKEIGGFDNVFFATYEDTDFCFRVRRAGYKILCSSKAKVWHDVHIDKYDELSRLLSRAFYISRNRLIFIRKHFGLPHFFLFIFVFQPIYMAYYSFFAIAFRNVSSLVNLWKGMTEGLVFGIRANLSSSSCRIRKND
jgi:GT2 family glycosyltransferase